jgi:hypothetical protein
MQYQVSENKDKGLEFDHKRARKNAIGSSARTGST